MADQNEVKIFKQYLIETNAFQTLVELLSSLRQCDPKPEDPVQYIQKRLAEPNIDVEEFLRMKQNMIQMNDEIAKLTSIVSKLTSKNAKTVEMETNDSIESMKNNVGDESYMMLNDNSLMNETVIDKMNETVTDSADLDSTMKTASTPNDTPNVSISNGCPRGFTMEIVEVDVVQQSQNSQELLSATQEEKIASGMEVDAGSSSITPQTSTPNSSESQLKEDPNQNGLAKECIDLAADESTESMQIESTDTSKATTVSARSLDDSLNITEEVPVASEMDINIEELPIVTKETDSEEQLQLSQPFCGFGSHDIQKSEKRLSNVSEQAFPPANDDTCNGSQVEDSLLEEPINSQMLEAESLDATIESDEDQMNRRNKRLSIVAEIVDTVVDNILDGVGSTSGNDITDPNGNCATESIRLLKDDPETLLFLAHS